jgi:hypothetical protein
MNDQDLNDLLKAFDNPNHCYPQRLVDVIRLLVKDRNEMQRELRKAETECSMLRVECGVIAAERDDARKEYCMAQSHVDEEYGKTTLPEEIAEERGWDCFNKNPTGNA